MNDLRIAVIGTAGRDMTKPMNRALWNWMLEDARKRIPMDAHLISGGAAWADHVAIQLFYEGHVNKLTLHLPAPITPEGFKGPYKSAASAANYYHWKFGSEIGYNTLGTIATLASYKDVLITTQPEGPGYRAMFARNRLIARDANACLAYTFGGDGPTGGTKDTWDQIGGNRKVHVKLPELV